MPHIIGKLWIRVLWFRPHLNWRFAQKVTSFQNHESPNFENFGTFNLRVPRQNDIWVLASWLDIENTIMGKPPSMGCAESCESVFAYGSFVHQKCSNYTLIKSLFGLCKSVWIIDSLVVRPSPHFGTLACPSTPKCYELGRVPRLFILLLFSHLNS